MTIYLYYIFRDTQNLIGPKGDEFQFVSWSPSGESMVSDYLLVLYLCCIYIM